MRRVREIREDPIGCGLDKSKPFIFRWEVNWEAVLRSVCTHTLLYLDVALVSPISKSIVLNMNLSSGPVTPPPLPSLIYSSLCYIQSYHLFQNLLWSLLLPKVQTLYLTKALHWMTPGLPLFSMLQPNITGYPHKHFLILPPFPSLGWGSGSCLCLKFHFSAPLSTGNDKHPSSSKQMTINSMQVFPI